MLARLVTWSGQNRLVVYLLSLALALGGLWAARNSPLDAVPDLSDPQVIVYAEWMGRSPQLVEDQVTYPLVTGLQALPGVRAVRGFTMFGMSFTYVLLGDDVDPYFARSRVAERLQVLSAKLPPDAEVSLGPDASAVGWVYQYALVDTTGRRSIDELRQLQDWNLRFVLEGVDGVAEVATVGGYDRQLQVTVDPERLRAAGLSLRDLTSALARSNRGVGGRTIEAAGRELYVQGTGYLDGPEALEQVVVGQSGGAPVPLGAVASAAWVPAERRGVADLDGRGEAVGAIVVARQGQNALAVIDATKTALASAKLPEGVEVVPVYDRSTLIRESVATLGLSLAEEMLVVAVLLAVFLLHARSVIVPIVVLPVAVLASFIPMYFIGVTLNIMSLAGIIVAVGDMVDAVVLLVENAARRAEDRPGEDRTEVVLAAARELAAPLVSSLLLIAVSFLPIFALQGQEGRLFGPLALTKTFAMLSAALCTLTLAPALAVALLRGPIPREADNPVNRRLRALYRPVVGLATRRPWPFVALALLATVATVPVYRSLGREFMPPLYEGSILYMPVTLPGVSIEEARRLLQEQDRRIAAIPEVARVFGKAGRAETATDPAPLSMFETTVTLQPREAWREGIDYDDIVAELDAALQFPGVQNAITMPIRARVDMLTTGIRTPVGVKVSGDDLAAIEHAARQVEAALRAVPGTRSAYAERQLAGVFVDVQPRRDALLAHGAVVDDVLDVVDIGLGGMSLGKVFDGRARYDLVARFGRDFRGSPEALGQLYADTPAGPTPLSQLADIVTRPGPAMLVDEGGKLAAYVYVDPGDRDIGGYVDEARAVVGALDLPGDIGLTWTGQFEFLERGQARMATIAPVALLLVFLLTWLSLQSVAETAIVLCTLPFSVLGSIWLLGALDYNLSIAAWVAMIALVGVGAEVGTVLAVYLDLGVKEALARGERLTPGRLAEVAAESAAGRMRGMVLALLMNLVGLLPVMFAEGAGADLARRMAGPMLGGLLTLGFMTALVLPALWTIWRTWQLRRGTLEVA
ncbi:MAG: efflux RND transporter permease subunit [Deltaproteobacteria bacterium]|nr:efflux RND transporter permease subunit [Deltaproteobacteria bacterium]